MYYGYHSRGRMNKSRNMEVCNTTENILTRISLKWALIFWNLYKIITRSQEFQPQKTRFNFCLKNLRRKNITRNLQELQHIKASEKMVKSFSRKWHIWPNWLEGRQRKFYKKKRLGNQLKWKRATVSSGWDGWFVQRVASSSLYSAMIHIFVLPLAKELCWVCVSYNQRKFMFYNTKHISRSVKCILQRQQQHNSGKSECNNVKGSE